MLDLSASEQLSSAYADLGTGRVAIAIPAYNEERFIGSVVIQAMRYSPQVIVVDDGSHDATAFIAEQAGAVVLQHEVNQGKCQAVNTALQWARRHGIEALVFIDGDGQHRPDEIALVASPILSGEADMVIGSRFLTTRSKIPAYRQVGQHLLTTATNVASSVIVSDSQSGFRAFSRRAIELLDFTSQGLSVESEMQFQAKEHKLHVVEVPISVIYAEKAKRNPFAHGMQIISNVAMLIGQHRPLVFFGVLGLISLLLGIVMGLVILDIYIRSHELAVGYSLIAIMFLILGVFSLFVGVILHSLRGFYIDLKRSFKRQQASTLDIEKVRP